MNLVIAIIVLTYAGQPVQFREEFRAPTEAQAMGACTEFSQRAVDRFSVTIAGEKHIGGSFVCVPKATK